DAYGKSGMIKEAEGVFDEAKKKKIADIITYSSMIDAYGKSGMIEEAREVFDEAKDKNMADIITYSSMIDAYGKSGMIEEAREVFDEAKDKNMANVVTYTVICSHYYSENKFEKVTEILNGAPKKIKEAPEMFLMEMEALRKQGRREEVIGSLSKFLKEYPTKAYGDERYVQAVVIRAYAQKDSEEKEEAKHAFEDLRKRVPITSIHYPRILCGYVFSHKPYEIKDKERVITLLKMYHRESDGNLRNDIQDALRLLERTQNSV
ncbi:MAG: hypothetical protein QW171_03110, partial [Candidatus Bilamarchaeaceae archaeon]